MTQQSSGDPTLTPQHSEDNAKATAEMLGIQSIIRENSELYENIRYNKRLLRMMLVVSVALAILLCISIFAFLAYPKTKYIATKDNAAICEVYPQDNPNITDVTIREFAKEAVLGLYTFDYVNYEDQINGVLERFFTPKGRSDVVKALTNSGTFEYVDSNALTFRALTTSAARIEQASVDSKGRTYWIVRFPLSLEIYSGDANPIDTQKNLATVRVVADTASSSNPNGLAVSSVTLAPL